MREVIEFLDKHKEMYIDFLAGLKGFPYICDYSSDILGAFLAEHFDEEIAMASGDYDNKIHTWIELEDGAIVDFSLCQFVNEYSLKEIQSMKLNGLNLYNEFVVKNNIPWVVTNDDELYDNYDFYEYSSLTHDLLKTAKDSKSLSEYLVNIEPYLRKNSLINQAKKKIG